MSEFRNESHTERNATKTPWLLGRLRRGTIGRLDQLQWGHITVNDPLGSFSAGSLEKGPRLKLEVHDLQFYHRLAFGGSVGAGEAYIEGLWDCDDLPGLIRILVRNREVLDSMNGVLGSLARWALRRNHNRRRNTRAGARRNISAHYDLSNEFFQLFLDESMMYSSAIYPWEGASLEEAQEYKLDQICSSLDLHPEDHLLEIGTGWGGLAIHAATHFGCRVTTTTISAEQYSEAVKRVRAAGLADKIEVLFKDYRDLEGTYTKLVSVEMIEAVGHRYYGTFFSRCSELLAEDGIMLLQTITIEDQRYDSSRRSVDYIKEFIFPGSTIPSITALINAATSSSEDLKLTHLDDITPHYATTLREWRERFMAHRKEIVALGYSNEFVRMWEYYFAYCEGAFEERAIGDVHMVFSKRLDRRQHLLREVVA